jgi:hypothetical protein
MSKNIVPRRSTQQVPAGYIWGRLPGTGTGPVQLLNLQDLDKFGIASKAVAAKAAVVHGFGFSISGRPGAGQIIGIASFPYQMTFTSGDPGDVVIATVAATSTAEFDVQTQVGGVWTTMGTLIFAAAGTTAPVAFTGGAFVLPAGQQFRLVAPASQDATLADISGRVVGVAG